MLRHKFKAFTIIELVVTMVITSIVIGIAVALYLTLDFYFRDTVYEYEKNNDILLTETMIKNDINNSRTITENNTGFYVLTTGNKIIRYEITDNYIIRHTDISSDTTFYNITDLTINTLKHNKDLVNEIVIYIEQEKINIPLHFYKKYSNDVLFEMEKTEGE